MIRPQYYKDGSFAGFSALLGGDWSAPQRYKDLMRAIADSGSDVLGDRRAGNVTRRVKDIHPSADTVPTPRMADRRTLRWDVAL